MTDIDKQIAELHAFEIDAGKEMVKPCITLEAARQLFWVLVIILAVGVFIGWLIF